MFIECGDGKVAVITGFVKDDKEKKENLLCIEPGNGNGVVGGSTKRNMGVPFKPIGDAVTFKFNNVESVRVFIEALKRIETTFD